MSKVTITNNVNLTQGLVIFKDAFGAVSASFDGTNDYLVLGSGLTGAPTASALNLTSIWFRVDDAGGDGNRMVLGRSDTASYSVERNASDKIEINLESSTIVLWNFTSTESFNSTTNTGWHNLLFVADLSSSPTVSVFLDNGILAGTNNIGPIAGNIDYVVSNWSIGATSSGNLKLTGELSEYYMTNEFLDITQFFIRLKFIDVTGGDLAPAFLGDDGSKPTGNVPIIYLTGGLAASVDNWHINKGTGGGFTENGALTLGSEPIVLLITVCSIWELDAAAFHAQSIIDDLMTPISGSFAEDIVLSTDGAFLFGHGFPFGTGEERIFRMPLTTGTPATATANVGAGAVNSITVNDAGSGYSSPPSVFITGDGINATATANVSLGQVTSIIVDNGGSGYTVATVFLSPPDSSGNRDLSEILSPDQSFNYESAIPDINLRGYGFNESGTRMYISDIGNFLNRAVIQQFTLSSPYNIVSAVHAGGLNVAPLIGGNFVREFHLVNGGVDLFLTNAASGKIQHMVLGVPDDITTAISSGKELNVSAQTGASPTGIRIGKNGTRLYTAIAFGTIVFQYNLLTPYDLAGTVTFTKSFDTASELGFNSIRGIDIASDGSSLYVVDSVSPHSAYQYILC